MFAWYESNLFFGNQSHDSHVWIDYIHLDKKNICRKDFACRNACLLPKFCHHSMFQCYFVVNGNKRKTVTKGRSVNLIHIRPCHIPSQLSAHGNITELRKMQWLLFNLFFPSNFEYHLCSGHMFESSICGHCYRNDFSNSISQCGGISSQDARNLYMHAWIFNILKLFMNILIYRLLSTCKTNTMFTGKFCYKSASENAA